MVAGLLGNKLGIIDFDLKRIYEYAIRMVGSIRDANATTVGNAKTMATELMSKFVSENINNALIIRGGRVKEGEVVAPATLPRGQLKLRYEPDTDELVVLATDLREYFVTRRVDFKSSLREFQQMGALVLSPKGDTSVVRRIAAGAVGALSAPPARCYVFKGAKLGVQPSAPADGDTA
jgi:hypothetical protein